MELKEYIKIIKNNSKLFWLVVFVAVLASFLFFYFRPVSYNVSLILNITRSGSMSSPSYNYGGFYRLQADEKFAETVVRWLKSPRVALNILEESGIESQKMNTRKLANIFKAEKMSSQIVSVSFSSPNEKQASQVSQIIVKNISQNTENLNKNQKEKDWFEIAALEPVIIKNQANYGLVFAASLIVGLFLAFWAVLLKHYFKE